MPRKKASSGKSPSSAFDPEQATVLTLHLPHPDGDVPITFRRIPAGSFRIGQRGESEREEPVTEVKIASFWMGETPVTQAQYRAMALACLEDLETIEGNKGVTPSHFKGDTHPVEQVSWDEAIAVSRWLSKSGLLPEGLQAGLPSEAMWEYACRAGTETEYWSGDGEAALAEVGWYDEEWGSGGAHPVGEKARPNPWGLHDLHGNVWEWCVDPWDDSPYRLWVDGSEVSGASNKERAPEDDRNRVLRGGSWINTARRCRSAYRYRLRPDTRNGLLGFRLCVFPGPVKQRPEAKQEAESATGGKARRDDAAVPEVADGAEWDGATLPAAKRPRKKPKK